MRLPVQPVLYVPQELGEVLPVRQQQIQDVQLVSQGPLIVQQQMLRPVLPVLLRVSLEPPISLSHVLSRRTGFVRHVRYVLLEHIDLRLVLP